MKKYSVSNVFLMILWKFLEQLFCILQGWTNFFLDARLFGRAILLAHPIGHAKNGWSKPKCTSNRDTTGNIAFCSLLLKQINGLVSI